MTTQAPPRELLSAQRKRILRYIGMALSALMVITVLTVLALIVRNESAHDEATCPFTSSGERAFEGGKVIEQQRTCVTGIAEHRYLVERPSEPSFELARKRLAADRFVPQRYRWDVDLDAQRRVVLKVMVDGKPASEFREEDAVKK